MTWTGNTNEVVFSISATMGFSEISVTYSATGSTSKETTSLTWSADAYAATIGAENTFPTLTTDPVDLEGVTYSSSNVAAATIAADGTITLVAPGTTNITASFAGNETHYAATAVSYKLTVKNSLENAVPYELHTGNLVEGDYVVFYANNGMKAQVVSNRLSYTEYIPEADVIYDPSADDVWHISKNGDYWTLYNAATAKYAAGNGTKNQAALVDNVGDAALWTATMTDGTFEFVNKKNNDASVNKNLRYNAGYGFACYGTSTGGALSLYKKVVANDAVTSPIISGNAEFVESTEVTIVAEDGLKVYYTLDGTDPTNASTEYTAPFELTATTTVKAVAYDGENASDIASKTFKQLQVLTCEEAAELCAATESADKYVIRGYVTDIANAWSDQYSNISFWMADTKDGGEVFEAFRVQPIIAAEKSVKVGDYVEVIGKIVLYNTTPETSAGGTYTIISAPVVIHTITATAGEGGSVTGLENDGVYAEGTELTLIATPADHYVFVNWTVGGTEVSTANPYTFTVEGDVELVANFLPTYTINVTTDDERGTIEGAGTYTQGAEVTLIAEANPNYKFLLWRKKGEEVEYSKDNPLRFTATENVDLRAEFVCVQRIVKVTAENGTVTAASGLVISKEASYPHGTVAKLTATPADHYVFVSWTKGEEVVSTEPTYTFTITEDVELVANFALDTHTVAVTAENGTVTGLVEGGTYEHGAEVTLTATPDFDYEFVKWSNESTDNPLTITVTDNETLEAIFAEVAATEKKESGVFSISAHKTATFATGNLQHNIGTGEWRFAKQQYQYVGEANINVGDDNYKGWIDMFGWSNGDVNKFGVNPSNKNEDYHGEFVDWGTKMGSEWSTLSRDQWDYLLFRRANYSTLKQIAMVDTILGIMLFPDEWTLPADCNPVVERYTYTEEYPGQWADFEFDYNHYTLDQWTKMEAAGAVFLPAAGRRTGGFGNKIDKDQQTVAEDYRHFNNANFFGYYWTSQMNKNNDKKEAYFVHNIQFMTGSEYAKVGQATYASEQGRYGQSVRLAKVVYDKHTVTATAENGTVTGAGEYTHGAEVTLTATANEHYVFVNWTKGEEVVAETAEYTFTVEADVELVANFKLDSHTVAATAENGTVTGAGEYTHGTEVTLTATANEHYVFVNWTKGEEVVAETAEYTFTVEADVELVANFKLDSHTVAATAENGTVTGAGEYTHGAEVTLTATPAEGYEFVNWTVGEETIAENPYKFTVTADVALVANFKEKVVAPTKLYLTPNDNWKKDNARFAAYFFGNGETWVSMTKVAGETDLYEVTIPTAKKYPNVIFCRMNPSASANNWNNKWNQTADLLIPTDGTNHYTVKAGTWDKGGGTWSIWPVPVVKTYKDITITVIANATPKIHYWEGGDKMVGSNWENKPEMVATGEENTYSYTIKDVDEATGVKYLVVVGDIQSADQITSVNVTKNFKEFLPQVAVQGVNNWDGTDKMTVSDDYQTASITLSLAANKAYELKLTVNGEWFGGKTIAITKDKNSAKFDTNGDGNGSITTDLAGGYVFTYTYETKTLTVAYPVSVTATAENGTVEGIGTYEHGTEVTLIATPAEGYEFVNWTVAGEEVADEATYTFVVEANVELVANFKKHETTIHIEPGNGKLSGAILTAFPGDTIILADGEYTEEKSFKLNKAGIIVKADEGAKPVIKASSYMQHYATITFIGITFDGQNTAEHGIYSYENTSKSLTLIDCEIRNYKNYLITCSSDAHVDSLVIEGCLLHDCGDAAVYFQETTLEDDVPTCSYFKMINSTVYNINGTQYYAAIDIRENTAAYGKGGNEVIIDHVTIYNYTTPLGAIRVYKSPELTISNSIVANPTAVNYSLYIYGGAVNNTLYFNGAADSRGEYTNCLNVDPLFVDAANGNFALMPLSPARGAATDGSDLGDPRWYTSVNKYTVTATANPAEAGTVSGAGEYIEGVAVTLVATPERGYSFVNWTVEGEKVSTESTYTFTPSANIELVANFEEIEFTGNIINVEPGKGTLATAVEKAEAGDKIVLADGIYTQEYSIAINKAGLIITAAEGAKPVIQLTDTFTVLEVSATTTFDGITFDATNVAKYIIAALDSEEMDAELTIINCEFKNWTLWAISNQYANNVSVRSVIIDNCLFHDGTGAAISFSNNAPEGKQACEYFEMTNSTLYKISESSYRGIINVGSNPEAEGDYNTVVIDHITMYDYTLIKSGIAAIAIRKTHNLRISNSIIANPEENGKTALNVYGGTVDNTIHYNGAKRSGSTVYTNCYNTDPMFTHAEHGIFCLQEGSPAIGAATDGTNLGDPRWNTPHYLVELSVNKEEAGTVEGAGVYKHGETVTVVAYAKPDYVFNAWADNYGENEDVTDRIYTFTITEDVNLEAIFTEQPGAPGNPTDIENNIISNSQVMKVIQNGRLFIIREGKIYNAQGQVVK